MKNIAAYLEKTRAAPQWKTIGVRPHCGICLPLSAIRSKTNLGIGEFNDLIPLIDWCQSVGFDCLQLLPINDTGDDPSPYNALSSCALDPVYLSLAALPQLDPHLKEELSAFNGLKEADRVAFSSIKLKKLRWLFKYYEQTYTTQSETPEYKQFIEENAWLKPYALFTACKDEFGGKDWRDWPSSQQHPETAKVDFRAFDFHCFLQFHAFSQMENVKRHAESQGVFLKGDVPILLSPDSVDVWAYRPFFNLKYSAGAPPDFYNKLGQAWGFPLFNWDAIREDGYTWWKQRLRTAAALYHLYRIDHVIGFFRIWAIKNGEKPANGRFIPANEKLWGPQGQELLEMLIDASPLLPIAEDLGEVPPQLPAILRKLGICGTKVIRWQRHWDDHHEFIDPKTYDPVSLTTVSTHDSETLELWWHLFPDEARRYAQFKGWTYTPTLSHSQRREILHDALHSSSLFHINLLQEYLALIPSLVYPNPQDERINIPGTLLPTNWTYRFKPTLEEITSHKELAGEIKQLLA